MVQVSHTQVLGAGSPRKCFGFKLLKNPFHGFSSHSSRISTRFQLIIKQIYYEKSDNFRKTVETGVDPCLQLQHV